MHLSERWLDFQQESEILQEKYEDIEEEPKDFQDPEIHLEVWTFDLLLVFLSCRPPADLPVCFEVAVTFSWWAEVMTFDPQPWSRYFNLLARASNPKQALKKPSSVEKMSKAVYIRFYMHWQKHAGWQAHTLCIVFCSLFFLYPRGCTPWISCFWKYSN